MNKRQSYLILNPYDEDAQSFIAAMSLAFGLRPICIYTDPKDRFYTERAKPHLRTLNTEEEITTNMESLLSVVDELNDRYDIRAVIPFREHYVEASAAMLERCNVDWMAGPDLALFRDKHRQKSTIAQRDPSVRVPMSRLVYSESDVFSGEVPDRFVIKPNDGAGSTNLGFFEKGDRTEVAAHLALAPGETWILEERIDGPEFRINGLIRRDGTVQVLLLTEYIPLKISDTFTLAYSAEVQLTTDDERWACLVDYAERTLRASGLWGSPFHLEVKVDDKGPAMIDLGGRISSDGSGFMMSVTHPDRPDAYAVAVRDYVGDNELAMDPPSYDSYNEYSITSISGISSAEGYIVGIDGVDEVEARPEFLRWIVKPEIGEQITPTRDLRSCPYIAVFRHSGGREQTLQLRDWLYETVKITADPELLPWAPVRVKGLVNKASTRGAWLAQSRSGS